MADGVYGFDPEIQDVDRDGEEAIALAASSGFAAPETIRADRITVDGTSLRFSDAANGDLASNPSAAPGFATLGGVGALTSVRGYYDASAGVLAGTPYGSEASGVRAATGAEFSNRDAFILSNGAGAGRFPIRAGTDGQLTAAEVTALTVICRVPISPTASSVALQGPYRGRSSSSTPSRPGCNRR